MLNSVFLRLFYIIFLVQDINFLLAIIKKKIIEIVNRSYCQTDGIKTEEQTPV